MQREIARLNESIFTMQQSMLNGGMDETKQRELVKAESTTAKRLNQARKQLKKIQSSDSTLGTDAKLPTTPASQSVVVPSVKENIPVTCQLQCVFPDGATVQHELKSDVYLHEIIVTVCKQVSKSASEFDFMYNGKTLDLNKPILEAGLIGGDTIQAITKQLDSEVVQLVCMSMETASVMHSQDEESKLKTKDQKIKEREETLSAVESAVDETTSAAHEKRQEEAVVVERNFVKEVATVKEKQKATVTELEKSMIESMTESMIEPSKVVDNNPVAAATLLENPLIPISFEEAPKAAVEEDSLLEKLLVPASSKHQSNGIVNSGGGGVLDQSGSTPSTSPQCSRDAVLKGILARRLKRRGIT